MLDPQTTIDRLKAYPGVLLRQPIYNQHLEFYAYELSYYPQAQGCSEENHRDLITALAGRGLQTMVGRHQTFVDLKPAGMEKQTLIQFPKNQLVLETPSRAPFDEANLLTLEGLSKQGYRLALLDYLPPQTHPLAQVAQFIVLDFKLLDTDKLEHQVSLLQQQRSKLVAKNVNKPLEFELCKSLGFDLIQGSFSTHLNSYSQQRVSPSRQLTLRLLVKLQNPEAMVDELDALIRQDATLSYKLLRLVNSAFFGLRRQLASSRQAIITLGIQRIKTWASLLALTGLDDRPNEIRTTAFIRARMCELLGRSLAKAPNEIFFSVGLFSALDVLLNTPLSQLLKSLPLAGEAKAAILEHEGLAGQILNTVLAYEQGDWDQLRYGPLPLTIVKESYLEALAWATEIEEELKRF